VKLALGSAPHHNYTVMVSAEAVATISGLTFTSGLTNAGTLTLTSSTVSGNIPVSTAIQEATGSPIAGR
jgi:hypothetical protein